MIAFLSAKYNLSFRLSDKLDQAIKWMFTDSQIANKMKIYAKKHLKFKPKHDLKSILRTAYAWHGKN
jgi:UDP-glucose 4-epimerase